VETPVPTTKHSSQGTQEANNGHSTSEPKRMEREQILKDTGKEWLFK